MRRDFGWSHHRLDHPARQDQSHGRLSRTPRRLDPLRRPTPHRIPTPTVPGRGRHRTLRRQPPTGRTTLRLGARHRREGAQELRSGMRCRENFAAKGRKRSEQRDPQLAEDIRAIVEPHAYADPELKSARRYTNLSAAEVRAALRAKGYAGDRLPSERAMRDILNRMNYRLKRIRKGKPLKKTQQTDAIFANVRAVQQQARDDPATLEISMDTKAKVALGEYVRGGKNPDRLRR